MLRSKRIKQLIKIDVSTEKTANNTGTRLILRDSVEIVPDSVSWRRIFQKLKRIIPSHLYRGIERSYRLFTPFNTRTGEFEIFIIKNDTAVIDLSTLRSSLLEFIGLQEFTRLFPFSFNKNFLFKSLHALIIQNFVRECSYSLVEHSFSILRHFMKACSR